MRKLTLNRRTSRRKMTENYAPRQYDSLIGLCITEPRRTQGTNQLVWVCACVIRRMSDADYLVKVSAVSALPINRVTR